MIASANLRALALVGFVAAASNAATPTGATVDTGAPATSIWQDGTVYRPDCPSNERDRRLHPTAICDDTDCRQ